MTDTVQLMKLSIITVCYNCADSIEQTVASVLSQTYPSIEYIIIDGCSTDGTIEILQKYSSEIDILITEPDRGIYDAMNKAIERATGDYLYFLNSGDTLYSDSVAADLMSNTNDAEIVYGDLVLCFSNGKPNRKMTQPPRFNRFLFVHRVPMHQATMVKSEVFCRYGTFDEEYLYSADLEFFSRVVFKKDVISQHVPVTICNYDMHGLSQSKKTFKLRQRLRLKILKKHFSIFYYSIGWIRYHLIMRQQNRFCKSAFTLLEKILNRLANRDS